MIEVTGLRTDRLAFPLVVGNPAPQLSWRLLAAAGEEGVAQSAYRIQVASDPSFTADVVDTDWVDGWRCLDRPWPAPPLRSRQRVWWRVQARTTAGDSAWSQPSWVEAGLLERRDWSARFVGPPAPTDPARVQPAALVRGEAAVHGGVASARLYVTGLGAIEAEVNGVTVGDEVLAPGWTAYQARLVYRAYDVTDLVRTGPNVIGVTLADGWFRGHLGWEKRRNFYGERTALLAQLEVVGADGSRQVFGSDESWRWALSDITGADLYDGEHVDARLATPGWSTPAFDASAWSAVSAVEYDLGRVVATTAPPVRRTEELPPVSITRRGPESFVVDFGQNLVGRLRLHVARPAGETVTLRHAEVLHPDGSLNTELLRGALATDSFTSAGAPAWFEPRFTFHGFRYAEVRGLADLAATDVVAVVIHSDMDRSGSFSCSDDLVNRLHENVVWGQRGNFVSVPTDCPQRDERLGWTGDAQVFGPTACFNFDAGPFLSEWLRDVAIEQGDNGAVPHVVPNVITSGLPHGACGWGDVASVMPWDLYVAYGDAGVLDRQYPSMRAWVEYELARAGDDLIWTGDFHFGDWLDPDAPVDKPWAAKADSALVATAYLVRSLDTVASAAEVLDRTDDALRYRGLAGEARTSWWKTFAEHLERSQTSCALALEFDLIPDSERAAVADLLARQVHDAGDHLATGFLGTPALCPALSDNGHLDTAYAVFLQRTPPSWLYTVLRGGTTIWERWDALRPDGTLAADALSGTGGSMISFNHYAYGAVADWMHRRIAGLAADPADPGYHHVVVRPMPGGGLTWAQATLDSRYGPVEAGWRREGDELTIDVVVPPNASATVYLPGGDGTGISLSSGRHRVSGPWPGAKTP